MKITAKNTTNAEGRTFTNYYLEVGTLKIQIKPAFKTDYVKLSTLAKSNNEK